MPVLLDLSEILHHPGMRKPYDVDVPCTEELEVDCASPVTGQVVFTNTGNILVIQGSINVTLRSKCPRCLTELESDLEAVVDEEFTVEHDQIIGLAEDDEGEHDPALNLLVRDGFMLNVTELVRQSIVLAEYGEPLCREDCKGLCPHCGKNLNEGPCDCTPEPESPFAALASLLPENAAEGKGE